MAVCKVNKAEAVALFSSLGLAKAAPKWTDEVLLAKIDGLAEIVRAVGKEGLPKKPEQMALLRTLVKAKQNGDEFALANPKKAGKPVPDDDDSDTEDEEEDDDAEEEVAEDDEESDSDADDSDSADPDDEDEDDGEDEDGDSDDEDDDGDAEDDGDEEDDDDGDSDADSDDDDSDTEDEGDDDVSEVATKPAKKAAVPAKGKGTVTKEKAVPAKTKDGKKAVPAQLAKKGGDGKPGIIASIVEFLQGATSEKAALSKKDILSKLTKRFPDTDADGMMKTINAQVPNRLIAQKGVNVVKTGDKRFYVPAAAATGKKKVK